MKCDINMNCGRNNNSGIQFADYENIIIDSYILQIQTHVSDYRIRKQIDNHSNRNDRQEHVLPAQKYASAGMVYPYVDLRRRPQLVRTLLTSQCRRNKCTALICTLCLTSTLQCGPARASLFRRFTDANVCGTGFVKIWKARHKISVDIRIFFYSVC